MVLDNSHFQEMTKSFPHGFKVHVNPVVYANAFGVRSLLLVGGFGAFGYLLLANYRVSFPYVFNKVEFGVLMNSIVLSIRQFLITFRNRWCFTKEKCLIEWRAFELST